MSRSQQRALIVAATAMLAVVLTHSYAFVPVPFHTLARIVWLVTLCLAISLAFIGWGGIALRLLGAGTPHSPAAAWASGAILGATLGGWLAQIWFPDLWLWAPWLLTGVLLCWWRRHRIAWQRVFPADRLLLFAGPFLLAAACLALAPPISLDALVYHLALPQQFSLVGRLFPMPWNLHAALPLHAEMLYGLSLGLDQTGRLAALLHLTAALAAVSATIGVGRRLAGERAGVWAGVVLYTLPVLALVSGWAWSDWFVILYAALALDALFAVRDGDHHAVLPLCWFAVAAPAVKYNALPLLILPLLVARSLRPRALLRAGGLAAVLLGPWYGRNLVLYGNPIHPLLSGSKGATTLVGFRGSESGLEKWLGYFGRPDLLDESLGALLAAGLLLGGVYAVRQWRRVWPLVLVIAIYLVVASVHHPTVRAFTPLLLATALLVGAGLAELWRGAIRPWVAAAVCLLLWVNLAEVVWVVREEQPSGAAFGYEKVETYLERRLDVYRAQRWINDNLPPGSGVLVVGDSRIFHLRRPAIAGTYLDPHPLTGFLRPGEELPALIERLRGAGLDYVLLNAPHYRVAAERQQRDELLFYVEPGADAAFRSLLAAAEPVYSENGVAVWRLVSRSADAASP